MKALIAMSGGVDSSVAALLMKEKGFECVGCTMLLCGGEKSGMPQGSEQAAGKGSGRSPACGEYARSIDGSARLLSDADAAARIAQKLGMEYFVFDFRDEFREKVIDKFASSYLAGRTPNPCVECNRYMKFGKLLEKADEMGCGFVVTGHYAKAEALSGGRFALRKAACRKKDQSYVLYSLGQRELSRVMFPLGDLTKEETRKIAEEKGFINADKPDSQDICFVPDGNYAAAVERFSKKTSKPGSFEGTDGACLGRHKGIIHYTIGQRKGLGISSSEPYYVCALCPARNVVVLGREADLMKREAEVEAVSWVSGEVPEGSVKCAVKIRYRHKEQSAEVIPLEDGRARVIFDEPQRAITPGQAAVFYDGDTVLGGGTIICSA